jgi:hypothetical protein
MKLSIVIIGIAMLVLSAAHSQNTEPTPLFFKCYNLSDSYQTTIKLNKKEFPLYQEGAGGVSFSII